MTEPTILAALRPNTTKVRPRQARRRADRARDSESTFISIGEAAAAVIERLRRARGNGFPQ